ncbi:PSP1-domain-containing protein, partial [Dipodascopsis tothii]|uniref:PSP1-domain-containing protein n=1 Tax=Dipodascopsis tothii TaxID=44089 RepID=UPI0034CF595C
AFYRSLCADVDAYFSHNEDHVPPKSLTADLSLTGSSSSSHTVINGAQSAVQKLYYVEFKGGRLDVFYIPEGSGLNVKHGDLVIVDADRGKDLGKVTHENVSVEDARQLKIQQHQEQQAALQQSSDPANSTAKTENVNMVNILQPKQIIRFAQPNEIQQLFVKRADEEKAMKICVSKVEERGMAMQVRDAEYQWDRRKLTFFYTASHRIDFRDLVRDLFRIYKTRIWMCAVN